MKVRCTACGLESGLADQWNSKEANRLVAVAEWNRRTLAPATATAVRDAAKFVEAEARSLKQASTTADGRWPDESDRALHAEMLALATRLRALLDAQRDASSPVR